ncbi:patatin-like protein 2 [Tanacetum coccineum]
MACSIVRFIITIILSLSSVSFGTKAPQQQYYPLCDNATTILSIDGGTGMRGGIIPSVALSALIATLLSTPNDEARPIFTAKDVLDFHLEQSARISLDNALDRAETTRKLLKDNRLHETLTNMVIPTYDIKTMETTVFSSYQLKKDPSLDAKLSDICTGTSSALPHSFQVKDSEGKLLREFNLIDGGVAANNPTMAAIGEASMDRRDSRECGRFLVLSLGTGSPSPWVNDRGSFGLDEYYILSLLELVHSDEYYLRIQDDKFSDNVALENLDKVGEELLKKRVTRVNPSNFTLVHDHDKTNELALEEFAAKLYKRRMSKIPKY